MPSLGREPEKHRLAPLPRRALATAHSAAPPTTAEQATGLWLARSEAWHRGAVRGISGWRRGRGGRPGFLGLPTNRGQPGGSPAMERTASRCQAVCREAAHWTACSWQRLSMTRGLKGVRVSIFAFRALTPLSPRDLHRDPQCIMPAIMRLKNEEAPRNRGALHESDQFGPVELSSSMAFCRLNEPGFCRGGNSLKEVNQLATKLCAGASTNMRSARQRW